MLSSEQFERLDVLSERIKYNSATIEDYHDYESIMIESGVFGHEDIQRILEKGNVKSFDELVRRRQNKEDEKMLRQIVAVGLAGLALALLFRSATN